jgi:hypothetical protein
MTPAICAECGNDNATEGQALCMDCLVASELGECDQCFTTYEIGSQLDHCSECGTCWDHCKGFHAG